MAEGGKKIEELEEPSEEEVENEIRSTEKVDEKSEKEEKEERKKGAIARKCTSCQVPLKVHKWPWGRKCPNKDLMNFDEEKEEGEDSEKEEDDREPEYESEGDEEIDENVPESEADDETEPEPEPASKSKGRRSRSIGTPKRKRVAQKGKKRLSNLPGKTTSTPRQGKGTEGSIQGISFVAGNQESALINMLAQRFEKIDARLDDMDRKFEVDRSRQLQSSSSRGVYPIREDVQMLGTISDAHNDLLDLGIIAGQPGPAHQKPIPGLKPVSEATDVRHLKPHQSVTDRTVKDILRGEYCDLQLLLPPEIEQSSEASYQAFIQDGQFVCKVKENKKEINSIVTWIEAWSRYEYMMIEFHGSSLNKPLFSYKLRVLDWNKKYSWPSVYAWDVDVRRKKSGVSMEFVEVDASLFVHHFDYSTLRSKLRTKCQFCNKDDHKGAPCPFREGPGFNTTGLKKPTMGEYKYGAARPDACYNFNNSRCFVQYCRWAHVCKGCGGPMPHYECKSSGKCYYARNS